MTYSSKQVQQVRRPVGWPTPEDFTLVEVELPEPEPGQIVVRNAFISVDPYMRGKMNDVKSYVPPFNLNAPMDGGAVGEVIASADPGIEVGTHVLHFAGLRDVALIEAGQAREVDASLVPSLSLYLGALGMTGLTAYVGLLDIAQMKPGETVFVSGAAGAVGQMVGQIARLKGAKRVIGSAGSAEKVAYLTDKLGFDTAFNYQDGHVKTLLRQAAPEGIDVYFDNVGGDHLEAALDSFNIGGRAAICGAIASYNATEPPAAPRNLFQLIGKRLTLSGFLVGDHGKRHPAFAAEVAGWLSSGEITYDETIVDGVENTAEAFLGMLRGENLGKMLVRI